MHPIRIHSNRFPAKQLQGQYCITPFILVSIKETGDVFLCGCSWWMSQPVGNIYRSTLDEILSSEIARDVRQSIIDGTYVYCNEKTCGVIANNDLNTRDTLPPNVQRLIVDSSLYDLPYHIHLVLDQTCNLSCPSCRNGIIKTPDHLLESQREVGKLIANNLFSTPRDEKIVLELDRKSTRLNSSHVRTSRMPSSA